MLVALRWGRHTGTFWVWGMYCGKGDKLWSAVEAIVIDEGLQLYDIERQGHGGLRVFVWRGKDEAGTVRAITGEDCSKIVRRLMVYFQVEGPELGVGIEPHMEVSSPGINRLLRLNEHLRDACGERVKVVCGGNAKDAVAHSGTLIGTLIRCDAESVFILDEQSKKELMVPVGDIRRAHIEFKF